MPVPSTRRGILLQFAFVGVLILAGISSAPQAAAIETTECIDALVDAIDTNQVIEWVGEEALADCQPPVGVDCIELFASEDAEAAWLCTVDWCEWDEVETPGCAVTVAVCDLPNAGVVVYVDEQPQDLCLTG